MISMPDAERLRLVHDWAIAISDSLDSAGLTPHEQAMCLLSACTIALALIPPAQRGRIREAHLAAFEEALAMAGER